MGKREKRREGGERMEDIGRERESVAPFVSVQHETGERAPGGRACVCVCVCVCMCVMRTLQTLPGGGLRQS